MAEALASNCLIRFTQLEGYTRRLASLRAKSVEASAFHNTAQTDIMGLGLRVDLIPFRSAISRLEGEKSTIGEGSDTGRESFGPDVGR